MNILHADIFGKIRDIRIEAGKIVSVCDSLSQPGFDAAGKRVIPGLIDLHSHGCMGFDTMDANFEPMCRFYAEHGTTSWLPTAMTMGMDDLLRVCRARTDFPGASVLGFHFEGPYLSRKYKGAQNEAFIKDPSIEEFRRFERVKMMTVAPENPGSMEFIREASKDCVISIGHTDCDYETALRAIENGADCLTHLYNAMPPFHHRRPGPIGAGFEKQIYAQIICDGLHVSKPAFLAAYRLFGADRLVLISDSIRPAGLPDGLYESGGLDVRLENGVARLADGTLAGSSATLWQCVQTAACFGVPFEEAVRMATATPAALLKVKKGKIEEGFDADLLVIGDNGEIERVMIGGEWFS